MKNPPVRLHGGGSLGDDASFMWVWRRPLDWASDRRWTPEASGKFPDDVYGILVTHQPEFALRPCVTMVYVKEPYDHTSGAIWKVLNWDPLTLEKAIECVKCGQIATIEKGSWSLV